MIQKKGTLVIFMSVLRVGVDAIDLSCGKVDPTQPSALRCTCVYTNGAGILWYKNGAYLSDCYLESELCLGYPGYSFSLNSSTNEYTFSVDFYNYSNCDVYTCRDLDLPEVNDTKMISAHNSTTVSILNISEPKKSHTSGFIGITTECIYGAISEENYLDIQVLVVMGNEEKSFNPIKTTKRLLIGSCRLCDGDKATQLLTGFYHKEEMECGGKEAQFRIILSLIGNPSEQQNITTRNYYCVSDQAADKRTKTYNVVIIIIIIFVFLIISLILLYKVLKMICRCMENSNPLDIMKTCAICVEEMFPFSGRVPVLVVSDKSIKDACLAEAEGKQPDNQSSVVSDISIKDACLAEAEGKQPDNRSSGYLSLTSEKSNEISCLLNQDCKSQSFKSTI